MAKSLVLEEIGSSGITELGRIESGEMVVGREPDDGLAITHGAISREHGVFMRVRNHWFYKDLESTNGSWINGEAVPHQSWRLIRPNDYLQMADLAVRLRFDSDGAVHSSLAGMTQNAGRSLIIFSDGRFVDEFPIPEFGRALVVGGSQGDLDIRGDVYENPSLVVERRGDRVCGYNVAKEYPLLVNGEETQDTVNMKDRDVLVVSEYTILYNDPPALDSNGVVGTGMAGGHVSPGGLRDWGEDNAGPDLLGAGSGVGGAVPPSGGLAGGSSPALSSNFGRTFPSEEETFPSDLAETVAIDPSQISANYTNPDRHPTMRHGYEEPAQYSFSSAEDKIIIFVGFLLFLVLALLVIWWVLV